MSDLPLGAIRAGDNDRSEFREVELRELADSIEALGLAQPITVRPIANGYEIVAGERRYRAHQLLGRATIPAIVRDLDDEVAAAIMLAENVMRVDINPLDEARAYDKRMHAFGWTVQAAAKAAKVGEARVRARLKLLRLIEDAQHLIATGSLGPAYGEAMSELDVNRQRLALRYLNAAKRPALAEFRQFCQQLFEAQSQESMFDADLFLRTVEETGEAPKVPRHYPFDETLPPIPSGKSVGIVLERFIVDLLAAGRPGAAAIVGVVYEAMLQRFRLEVPTPSPIKES